MVEDFGQPIVEQLKLAARTEAWSTDPFMDEERPGQWRLARVDVANWGTFCGYHHVDVDRKGLLITGASGSGKSTLLDAVTMVLTPPRNRHLNAAARSGSSKGEDRTPVSYMRGAWRHETDETGEVTCSYLRPNTATWSGILLRYENGLVADEQDERKLFPSAGSVNLLALFNLKAASNTPDGITQIYAIIRGDCTLEHFEKYAINGIDPKKIKGDYRDRGQTFREHSSFAASFCRQLGIAGPKTLELLHKTHAAKNFGSLDDLFRNFMLDEPKTFAQVEEAVEQFMALSQAHAGVVEQRKQMELLEPLVGLDQKNAKARNTVAKMQNLTDALPGYTEQLALNLLQTEREQLQRESDRLIEAMRAAEQEQRFARQAYDQAQKSLVDAGGGALDMAEAQMLDYQRQLEQVAENRSRMHADLRCANVDELPRTFSAWQELGRTIGKKAVDAEADQEEHRVEQYRSYGLVPNLQEKISATEDELRHLRSQETNIPKRLHLVRMDIAKHLGIPFQDLPFVGELVSVKPEFADWRGAIERLLGNRAKTLLVVARDTQAVSRYVNENHLGVRLEFISVPPDVEVPKRSLDERSLVNRLAVKHHPAHPEYTLWINRHLRERFNFICVQSSDDLMDHRFALTREGLVKHGDRYVKDDRFALDDRARWVLGNDNEEKVVLFTSQLATLRDELAAASKAAQALLERTRRAQELQRASALLMESSWKSYDIAEAEKACHEAVEFYQLLSSGNEELAQAATLRDEAQKRRSAADTAATKAQLDCESNRRQLETNEKKCQQHADRAWQYPGTAPDEATRLLELFRKTDSPFDTDESELYRASMKVSEAIGLFKTEAMRTEQGSRDRIERIMHEYRQEWKLQAADLSEDFPDKDAYIGIYRQIKLSGLPDYEQRFLHVLHDFSQDQITVIASTIRSAAREVKEKLIPVNRSLELSPYSSSTHLQIKAKDNRNAQVSEFLDTLKEITHGTWDEQDIASAEARFLKTNAVIKRLKSSEYADRVWRKACLDTRQHVSFIANEIDADAEVVNVHSSDTGLSGGQKQKLVIFCLAAALRYQLSDEDQPLPRYGSVVLDEAFDKADPAFARTAMEIFRVFGFHMILATPYKLISVLTPYIGAIVTTHCPDSQHSSLIAVDFEEEADEGSSVEGTSGEDAGGEDAGSGSTSGKDAGSAGTHNEDADREGKAKDNDGS